MKKRENYLLFVPSLITDRSQTLTYTAGEKQWQYEGMQTNEAVTKYIADLLHEEGTKLTRIILLCSEEVCNEVIGKAGGRTTLEYYKDTIWSFLEKYRTGQEDRDTFFKVIPLKVEEQQTAEDIVEPIRQVLEITEETLADGEKVSHSDKHLYVDFTGGLRNAALMLVFACRLLQRLGVSVEKILYSNIGTRTVEECTRTYEYFDYFEYLVKRALRQDDLGRYDPYLKKVPKQEQASIEKLVKNMKVLQEKKELNRLDEMADTSRQALEELEQVTAELEKTAISQETAMVIDLIKEDHKDIQVIADNSRYPELPMIEDYLKTEQYDKALNLYREKIMNILFKGRIIQVDKRFLKEKKDGKGKELNEYELTQEIVGVYCYYEHPDKRSYPNKTFMDAVFYALGQLSQMPDQDPEKVIQKTMGDEFYDISYYLNKGKIPSKSFIHTNPSRNFCNQKIFPYLKDDYGKEDINEFIDRYNKLDRIYMCYGFPFAATYDRRFLKGYDQVYKTIFHNGIGCLQEFYEGKSNRTIKRMMNLFPGESFTYETLLQALTEKRYERMLRILFPYRLQKWKVYSDVLKGESWDEFIYDFVKSFCFIKNVRNKKIHKSDLELEDMQEAILKMKNSLAVIKKYIH